MATIVIRSPEATFRPEGYIVNHVVRELVDAGVHVTELWSAPSPAVSAQTGFFDNATLSRAHLEAVRKAISVVRDGDTVFFSDLLGPPLSVLRMHAYCAKIRITVCGVLHCFVNRPRDFLYDAPPWAYQMESHMLECADEAYVATPHGQECIRGNRFVSEAQFQKVKVVRFPFLVEPRVTEKPSRRRVVFAHRWSPEKNPQQFTQLAALAAAQGLDMEFVVLHPTPLPAEVQEQAHVKFILCRTRSDYERELQLAHFVFSASMLESFGYAIIDGLSYDAIPVVPDVSCYPFLYKPEYVYPPGDLQAALACMSRQHQGFPLQEWYSEAPTIGASVLSLTSRHQT